PTIDSSADTIIGALRDSIESIFDLETVFNTSDFSEEEITKFIESMTQKQLMKVVDFFENIPKVKLKVEVINPNTKVKSEVELEGLDSFF
ncbi:MAG: baseplate protein, partial [Gammaproteobacteria bacterium]|nr:baseplate protein [Gammaproteobacteria bacterium]